MELSPELKILILINFGLNASIIGFMTLLHFFHNKEGYYKYSALSWLGVFLALVGDSLGAPFGAHHLTGIVFANLTAFYNILLSNKLFNLKIQTKNIMNSAAVSWLLGACGHFFFSFPFWLSSLVIILPSSIYGFICAWNIFKVPNKSLFEKIFALTIIAQSLHVLDYPFIRNLENSAAFGFTFAMVLSYLASVLLPVIINRKLDSEIKESLNELVEQKVQELRKTQAEVMESRKLVALGEMAGGIAHEINNPLAIITTRSQHIKKIAETVLKGETGPQRLDLVVNFANIIFETSDRISKIVSGLRTFSRSGDSDPYEREFLYKIIEDTLALSMERMKWHNIKVYRNIDESIAISCRATQISQVILNILNNATHEMIEKADGERRIEIDALKDGNNAILKITDNGRGIPSDQIEKVMQPFFTTKPVGKGTGLGLSISKGIIESHQGKIAIESKPGQTSFIITFPLHIQELVS